MSRTELEPATTRSEPEPKTPGGVPEAVVNGQALAVNGHAPAAEQLDQLKFLHRVARLATTASTWDELLETVVDETRDALRASVSSLYLLDRDGENLTLAATNGLDRFQIGRAKVPFGQGVTGRVAASRQPTVIYDVGSDPRFLWVRGIDQRRFIASMLSVPLVWNDRTVGVPGDLPGPGPPVGCVRAAFPGRRCSVPFRCNAGELRAQGRVAPEYSARSLPNGSRPW